MREAHPDWTWNRSDTHVFLSEPGSLEPFKVVAEPGNSFSPGAGSFGVSTWIWYGGEQRLYAPELMGIAELEWSFAEGHLPILISRWDAGAFEVESRLFTSGDNATSDYRVYLRVLVTGLGAEATGASAQARGRLLLAIRSFGPAGGPIRRISASDDRSQVLVNGHPAVYCGASANAFHAASLEHDGFDISVPASNCGLDANEAAVEAAVEVTDAGGWASAALGYDLDLEPGQAVEYSFVLPIHAHNGLLTWLHGPETEAARRAPQRVAEVETATADKWRTLLHTIELDVPDRRFADAFYSQVAHEFMATVHQAVRISPISYPMWWLRDGVYLLNALDKAGLHDFAREASLHIAHMDAFGGMGAEGDGPGESLWILTEHYFLTRDADYLRQVYPHVARKADLITKMLHTDKPVKGLAEFRTTQYLLDPSTDILCGPASDGLISGRMDGHYPKFWVNGFAYAGLTRAAKCARLVGDEASAAGWEAEAGALREAILRRMPEFGSNDRDVTGGIWPNKAIKVDDPGVREAFRRYWNDQRSPGGLHRPERLWTYFELGQAHNYMFLGMRDEMWVSLNHFLENHTAQGLYTWSEGEGDENSSGLWQTLRGWDRIPFVTPHGWTSAELFLLLRDAMAYEDDSGEGEGAEALVIGAGVPAGWLQEPGRGSGGVTTGFGVKELPTYFGKCSWRLEGNRLTVSSEREPPGGYVLALPGLSGATPVTPPSGAEGVTVEALGDGRFGVRGARGFSADCRFQM